jgi:serine/threonine protein phosphatase PrpC
MQCPTCTAELPDDDVFCETCGARLTAAAAAPALSASANACTCGAPPDEIDRDGFCSRCGLRVRRPPTDRIEMALSPDCAAVSDRGLRHARNEDRFGIEQAGSSYAFVVCDGVSTSHESEIASSQVAQGIATSLAAALKNGGVSNAEAVMRRAIAAEEAVLAAHPARGAWDNPPSTTVVAALVSNGQVTVGWVGDSRAYWIGPTGARQLTSDHSWMNAVVSAGEMTSDQAEKDPQAHAITRWLGADAGENSAADTAQFPIAPPGILLLCTDGLWNYAATPEAMAKIVEESKALGADALAIARNLITFATNKGGHDNITALVLLVPN